MALELANIRFKSILEEESVSMQLCSAHTMSQIQEQISWMGFSLLPDSKARDFSFVDLPISLIIL